MKKNFTLSLGYISEKIGKIVSHRDISQFRKGLDQKILKQHRLKGSHGKVRGILLIVDPNRLKREFEKYVPDYDPESIADAYYDGTSGTSGTQKTIDPEESTTSIACTASNSVSGGRV